MVSEINNTTTIAASDVTSNGKGNDGSEKKKTFSKDDFQFGKKLGEGAYSRVHLSIFKPTGKKYATKIIQKDMIMKMNKIKTIKMEKQVMHMMDHPNIIKLFCTYQDKDHLYFALEFASGGELFSILKKYGPLSLDATVFYTAEIVNALEYMHGLGILHRDLKPENIIFSSNMHVKITDFGTAKIKGFDDINENDELMKRKHKQTFVGTAEYVSPEILKDSPCTEGSDLWALGCIIYQCLTGKYPFKAESEYLTFQRILNRDLQFPSDFPEAARDIVDKLLQLKPEDRLGVGANGYDNLKSHPFFEGLDFNSLNEQVPPIIIPPKQTQQDESMGNFQMMKNEPWKPYLLKGENVVYTSSIVKRRGLSAKKRQLIVTDKPRIMYVDTGNQAVKGTIPWCKELKVIKKTDKDFIISTPGRDYILEDQNCKVDEWVKAIDSVHKQHDDEEK